MNYTGYKMQARYPLDKFMIKKHVEVLFHQWDPYRTGYVDVHILP